MENEKRQPTDILGYMLLLGLVTIVTLGLLTHQYLENETLKMYRDVAIACGGDMRVMDGTPSVVCPAKVKD